MKIILLILSVVSFLTWAQARQNKTKERKPAETHGGVIASNAQFNTAAQFALKQGGSLSRVMSVKKRIDCTSDTAAYFEIIYGGQNSQTGKESLEGSQIVKVPHKKIYTEMYQKDPMYDGEYKAEMYSGKDCK